MAFDPFQPAVQGDVSPATQGFAITPNDSTDLATVVRAIYVGVGGQHRDRNQER
jgi:hypothetical protein